MGFINSYSPQLIYFILAPTSGLRASVSGIVFKIFNEIVTTVRVNEQLRNSGVSMKLVAGSYERFLWGWQVKEKKKELQWTFAYPAHIGPIKCIASSGAVVATGGADDTIKVFDINAQKDMGSLYKHEGAVTCLDFHGSHPGINHPTHLLSGSEDGSICIWDTDSWIHLTTMKTKKGPRSGVNDLSIHPSGDSSLLSASSKLAGDRGLGFMGLR